MSNKAASDLAKRKWETLTATERAKHIAIMVDARQKQRKLAKSKKDLAQVKTHAKP